MLSSVLSSKRAIQVNIAIVRAFVKLREILTTHKDLAYQLDKVASEQKEQGAHIQAIWKTIQKLIDPPRRQRIGFKPDAA